MNKHEQLIQSIADEMAKESHQETYPIGRESLIERYTPSARVAVKHMADTATVAYLNALGYNYQECASACDIQCMIQFLKDNGLIPSTNK